MIIISLSSHRRMKRQWHRKVSQEFPSAENRFLSILYKLDESRMLPQIRVKFKPGPEVARNSNEEDQELEKTNKTKSRLFPELSWSWNEWFYESVFSNLWPRLDFLLGDASSWSNSKLLSWDAFGQAKKSPLYESTAIPQWKLLWQFHTCDNWSRTNFWPFITWRATATLINLMETLLDFSFCLLHWQQQSVPNDSKIEKLRLFAHFFHTRLKVQNLVTKDDRTNKNHSLTKSHALQTLKNTSNLTRAFLGDFLSVSGRILVKPLWIAEANCNQWLRQNAICTNSNSRIKSFYIFFMNFKNLRERH